MPFCELRLEQNKNEITAILINEVMRKNQVKKSYSAPECMIIQVNEATNLMQTSFPTTQHKKAHKAAGPAAAKASQWNDEDLEDESTSSWED